MNNKDDIFMKRSGLGVFWVFIALAFSLITALVGHEMGKAYQIVENQKYLDELQPKIHAVLKKSTKEGYELGYEVAKDEFSNGGVSPKEVAILKATHDVELEKERAQSKIDLAKQHAKFDDYMRKECGK